MVAWTLLSSVLWLAGGAAHDAPRVVLWLIAVAVDYTAPMHGFATPFLGRSLTREWTIGGGYLAERCQLFVIITFGESIVRTGTTFSVIRARWSAAWPGGRSARRGRRERWV